MEKADMIFRNGEWVPLPPEPATPQPARIKKKRKKRRVTPAMHRANKSNSLNSTGPTSESGKRASSANSVRHGCACKELFFLDDEDPERFFAVVDARIRELNAVTAEEKTLVTNAVYSELVKIRAANAHVAAINEVRAEVRDQFADKSAKAVRAIIPRLVTEPDVAVEELRDSTRGCDYLLGQFKILRSRLEVYNGYEIGQRRDALRMAGHRPEEMFKDDYVFDFNKCYLGAISGEGGFSVDEAGNAFMHDRTEDMCRVEFIRMLEPLVKDLPSLVEGHRRLSAYLDKEIQEPQRPSRARRLSRGPQARGGHSDGASPRRQGRGPPSALHERQRPQPHRVDPALPGASERPAEVWRRVRAGRG